MNTKYHLLAEAIEDLRPTNLPAILPLLPANAKPFNVFRNGMYCGVRVEIIDMGKDGPVYSFLPSRSATYPLAFDPALREWRNFNLINEPVAGDHPEIAIRFPRGVDSWAQTHFYIATDIYEALKNENPRPGSLAGATHMIEGVAGCYELANDLTTAFEWEHRYTDWGQNEWEFVIKHWLEDRNL